MLLTAKPRLEAKYRELQPANKGEEEKKRQCLALFNIIDDINLAHLLHHDEAF